MVFLLYAQVGLVSSRNFLFPHMKLSGYFLFKRKQGKPVSPFHLRGVPNRVERIRIPTAFDRCLCRGQPSKPVREKEYLHAPIPSTLTSPVPAVLRCSPAWRVLPPGRGAYPRADRR